ncbi:MULTISPECIES: SDR family oxidoreductase [Cyclobacteriaceae]|jgi:NAD(P)H dehydrogenase (quinone)|uniref:SDR family oxidoreductase n=5 Tax=Cyclobacteriaceae TaxID=563798 RepID=A0A5C7B8G8_9BACT|nr:MULTISPECIES: SDR family oxidoreductase [Cyclobacteriaceae]MBA4299423.1 SDR family NAD(P)-dependent oxidoreductase [Cyclobacterium sp.]AFL85302.1 putative nucleoside-diphosphate sugar epimerase [Belliella baltica DSM 15883]MAL13740.1 NAD(P)-dependent oxidoreductase [Algoriphagus sp.]MBB6327603.1 NAD(P)H dehydrogenase (quinone) [Algoriphagus iocasae]MBS4070452.1 SDR family oxidoreductase [Algoriphagus sp.]|tara:strand:+ start:1411 stop:2280 length:870 start_codon:yes stop_codon:yes gene_type:complete
MILITGANGHLGAATIESLLKKNPKTPIRALVRTEEKGAPFKKKGVDIAIGDYFNYDSLLAAMRGVDVLLLVSSSSITGRYEQHSNAIKAAKESGIKHIVYTSVLKSSPDSKFSGGMDHVKTEAEIKASGIPYTIMGNTYYADFLPMLLGDFTNTGAIYYSAGDARVNFASRNDMAEANAVVLSNPSAHQNKVYNITALKAYTFTEIAVMLSDIVNAPVNYVDIPLEDLKKGMLQHGLPENVTGMMASIAETMKAGEFDYADDTLKKLIGHPPLDLKDFLKSVYGTKSL